MAGVLQKLNQGGYPLEWVLGPPCPQVNSPLNSVNSGDNADGVVTLAADAGDTSAVAGGPVSAAAARPIVIPQINWSYSALPAALTLVILKDGTNVIFQEYISANNIAGERHFNPPLRGTAGSAITLTAKAGGSGIFSQVTIPNPYVLTE